MKIGNFPIDFLFSMWLQKSHDNFESVGSCNKVTKQHYYYYYGKKKS